MPPPLRPAPEADVHYTRRMDIMQSVLDILQGYPTSFPEKCFNKLNSWFFKDAEGQLQAVRCAIYHPRKAAQPHGVSYAPTLNLGASYFKISDQPAQKDKTILVWLDGGSAFKEFRTPEAAAKWIGIVAKQRNTIKPRPMQAMQQDAKTTPEPAKKPRKAGKSPVLAAPYGTQPQKKDEPRPTRYVKQAFTDVGLRAFWKKDSGGSWRIAVHEPQQSPDVALLVTKHIWNMMKTRGVRTALSILGLAKEIEQLEKEAA